MKKFIEALPIIVLFGLLLGPAAYFGQWWLFAVFLAFGLIFGIIEVVSIKVSGKSVSQHFWALKDKSPRKAIIILVCMVVAWGLLILHFWWH